MKVALSMMNQVWEDKQENIKTCERLVERSFKNKADLLIFPQELGHL